MDQPGKQPYHILIVLFYEEALENIKDAIVLMLEDMQMSDETAPDINSFSLVAVEVTA